jgi:hypothetical protein
MHANLLKERDVTVDSGWEIPPVPSRKYDFVIMLLSYYLLISTIVVIACREVGGAVLHCVGTLDAESECAAVRGSVGAM